MGIYSGMLVGGLWHSEYMEVLVVSVFSVTLEIVISLEYESEEVLVV